MQRNNESVYGLRARSRSFTSGDKESSNYRVGSTVGKLPVDSSLGANKLCVTSEWRSKERRDCTDFVSTNGDQRTEKRNECPTRANICLSRHPSKLVQRRRGKRRRRPKPYFKKSKRQQRVKRTRKIAEIRDSCSPCQVPSHSSKASVKHYSSSACASKDAGTDNSGPPNGTAYMSQTSDQEYHGMPPINKCYHTYSDNTSVNQGSPTANGGTTAYMTSGNKLHGRATVNRDIHVRTREGQLHVL